MLKCRQGFPQPLSFATVHVAGDLRYIYRRTVEADRWVSPYVPSLLLLWGAHINVQYVTTGGIGACISKYVTKPEKKSQISVSDADRVMSHITGRRIGSMEVMVLLMGFLIFNKSSAVEYLPTDMAGCRSSTVKPAWYLEDNPDNNPFYQDRFEEYYARPFVNEISACTYFQYFQRFTITSKKVGTAPLQHRSGHWVVKRKNVSLYII